MELEKRFDFKIAFFSVYIFAFLIYLIIGFLPAEAANYKAGVKLEIPAIGLTSDVINTELKERALVVPDYIVGSFSRSENKTLLIGHSTTVFQNLGMLKLREKIIYNDRIYKVIEKSKVKKDSISMNEILKAEEKNTLKIMTCAGELLENQDATHRLIITAVEL